MPTWLGIDIGSASVKVALVRSAYRKISLVRTAIAEVAASGGVAEAARIAVSQALADEPRGPDAVATAIDGARAAIHRLLLPATAQKQLADVLTYELGAQVPFDLETAVFDWRLLGRTEDDQLSIVAAVARVDDVRARIELVKAANAQEPERVGVGALALGALVPFVPALAEAGCVAIVELGAKAQRSPRHRARRSRLRAHAVARDRGTARHGAPSGPRHPGQLRGAQGAGRSGPRARVPVRWGSVRLGRRGLPLRRARDPRAAPPAADARDRAAGRSRPGAAAIREGDRAGSRAGGRGSGLNLRRGPLAFERGFGWVRERIPVLAGLAAVLLVSFLFSGWARIYEAHSERDVLRAALGTVTKEVLGTEATSAQDAQDLLAKEAVLSDEDPMPHADGFDVMVRLSQAIPSSVKHDVEELDLQKGHVIVRGIAGSIPESQAIASALADDPCTSDAKIKSTTQMVGSDRQKYLLEFDLKCPEDAKPAPKKKGESSSSSAAPLERLGRESEWRTPFCR